MTQLLFIVVVVVVATLTLAAWSRGQAAARTRGLLLQGWKDYAARQRLEAQLLPERPVLWGEVEGVRVRVAAETPPGLFTAEVHTLVRASHAVELPKGLELRYPGQTVEGGLGLPEIEAHFDVRAADTQGARALLSRPEVQQALLGLTELQGVLLLGPKGLHLVLPTAVHQPDALQQVVSRLVDCVKALHEALPARRAAQALKGRPALSGLLLRAASAGTTTQVARETLERLKAEPCSFRVEVERVAPDVDRLGAPSGHRVIGMLAGATCRVEVRYGAEHDEAVLALHPGDRLEGEGYLESYDAMVDRAEVLATTRPKVIRTAPGPNQPDPAALVVLGSLVGSEISDDEKQAMLEGLGGQVFQVRIAVSEARVEDNACVILGVAAGIGLLVRLHRAEGCEPPVEGALVKFTARARGWEDGRAVLEEVV